jgi:hypothetical protein
MAPHNHGDDGNMGEFIQEERRRENVQQLVNLTLIFLISAPIFLALISILLPFSPDSMRLW